MSPSLALNKFAGKAVGVTLGLAVGGPLGALLGAGLGHAVDAGWLRWRLDRGISVVDARQQHAAFLFRWLGHLAKADGRVSERDIEAVERLMTRLNLSPEERRDAVDAFQYGRTHALDASAEVRALKAALGEGIDAQELLRGLVAFALKDGKATWAEHAILERLGAAFGWSKDRIGDLLLRPKDADAGALSAAYETIGARPDCSDDELTRSYRRLLAQQHPDKLQGAGASAEAIAGAQARTHALRAAYERITAARAASRSPPR